MEAIIGVPEAGERLDGQTFDGEAEAAIFPGQLPVDPHAVFAGDAIARTESESEWRFLRFRPPLLAPGACAPHIRLDRALQFLIGDKLA